MADGIDATHAKQNLSTTVDAYSAATDSWRTIALLPDPRDGLMKGYGLVVENKFYLVSGSTVEEDYVNTTEAVSFSTDLMF
jgi:N-acetylneuraminic acid mutarotase